MRFSMVLASAVAMVMIVVGSLTAQTQAPPQVAPPVPGDPALQTAKEVEGTVKKVDPAARSVQVSSGPLGVAGATLNVTDETKISVQGKKGSIADIQEGAKIKASYENRDGRNVAKSIEVMAAEAKQDPAARPAPGVFPGSTPPGTPPPPAPKTQ